LLDRLYESVYEQDEGFRCDMQNCRNTIVRHSIGVNDIAETVLTENEFCERLTALSKK